MLFKSQNNRTWTPVDSEDLKFTLNRAEFNTAAGGNLTLQNQIIGDSVTNELGQTVYGKRLYSNPLVMTNGSTTMKVKHFDHGMYQDSNNVRITGVSSEISVTLDGAITASDTSLTLASVTNIPTGSVTLKIGNEIISGTRSGTSVTGLTKNFNRINRGSAHATRCNC